VPLSRKFSPVRSLILLVAVSPLAFAEDARVIVRRSIELDRKYLDLVRQYTFIEHQENRQFDGGGKVKDRESRTWDVTLQVGSPYRRLIARDGKPLPVKDEALEQEKLKKSIEQRQQETEAQRQARLNDAEHRLQRQREPLLEIPDAFDLKLAGEEPVNGNACWVIEATPKRGYKPRSSRAVFFPKVRGKLWVSKIDYQWVKVEGESIDTISFGLILARVAKGARIRIEQTRVNDEVWLPLRIDIAASARIALFKTFRGEVEINYRDYKKFQADSRIVETGSRPLP
jgi:hypothetical protein